MRQDIQVATIDHVTFEPESWDPPGPIRVVAVLSDGREVEVFRYYSDELRFSADDFVGRTVEEARKLHRARDSKWLRS